jgi:hypothetical protein
MSADTQTDAAMPPAIGEGLPQFDQMASSKPEGEDKTKDNAVAQLGEEIKPSDTDEKATDEHAAEDGAREEKVEEEAATETLAAEPTESELHPRLVAIAKEVGLTDENIAAFGNNDQLEGYLRGLAQQRPAQQAAEQTPAVAFEALPAESQNDDGETVGFDRGLVEWSQRAADAYNKQGEQLAGLQQAFEQLSGYFQSQREQASQQWLDKQHAELGEHYHDVFGSKPPSKLKKDSPEAKAWNKVIDLTKGIVQADGGKTGLSQEELLLAAVQILHPRHKEKAARHAQYERGKKRAAAAAVVPDGGDVDPDAKAKETIANSEFCRAD